MWIILHKLCLLLIFNIAPIYINALIPNSSFNVEARNTFSSGIQGIMG